MRRREYLKHKNGDLEELPMRLSMRNSAKYGNCNWKPYVYHSSRKLKMIYHRIDHFLKSSIGKKFDDVYSEFRQKFPERFAHVDLVENFKSSFREYQDHHTNWEHSSYYVDKNGLIQNDYVRPKKNKVVRINKQYKETKYSFSDYVYNDRKLLDIVQDYLPGNYHKYLIKGTYFTEKLHKNFIHYLFKKSVKEKVTSLYSEYWFFKKGIYHAFETNWVWEGNKFRFKKSSVSNSGLEELLFRKHIIEEYDEVEIGSPEFIRNFEDNRKKNAAIERIHNKELEKEREALLHDLLQERKAKEKEENELIRDRHGFDDHSFKNW